MEPAASAMATLIDLACELQSVDYFRSDDPVEAARFVVSDAVAMMWSAVRREQVFPEFCERAAGQLLRWESRWGWTRRGEGWVAARERLAHGEYEHLLDRLAHHPALVRRVRAGASPA